MKKFSLSLLILLSLVSAGIAEPLVINLMEGEASFQAGGRDVVVTGSMSDVWIAGPLRSLTVEGHNNDIYIDESPSVLFRGTNNDVWIRAGNPQVIEEAGNNDIHMGSGR